MAAVPFPALIPTARSFELGDFPVKTFKAQNGAGAPDSVRQQPDQHEAVS